MNLIIVGVAADGPTPAEFTLHNHNPVDDARGSAEALKKFAELGLKI
jgi:hypothetical protein